ncbi:hypothetical protein AALF15_01300 [Corynebacteriaceae bacterium 7-707]
MSTITVTIAINGETFNEHSITDMGRDAADMRTVATRLAPTILQRLREAIRSSTAVYREVSHGVTLADGEPFTRG